MTVCATCGHESAEAFKFCPECGAPAVAEARQREQRKTVTVLFCDVTGSTALGESTDPEALRALLARYFERMKAIVESHGGTVEKFIGDAVMAVFGVPQVHEDDALRACRAAVEMRESLPELGVEARIGVNTGEVVTGTEERLATGDAVNVAARLEQAAQPGEVLIGEATLALVRDAVEAEPVEPLGLKGKAEPVPAFRLDSVVRELERFHETLFVGREHEFEMLEEAWRRALDGQRCELVTIVGDAGVGKSRLVAESLSAVDAPVVRGRCLPYGEGITYWPVVEALKQLAAVPSDPAAAASLSSLLGETEQTTTAEEIAWAFRKLLEEQAPLVCLFDDVHWAEETFLDLVEHVALLSAGAPILLVCMARPDLIERRPQWPVTLRLEPLPEQSVDDLIPGAISGDLRGKIAQAAGGNPLFVQEMVAMAAESEGDVVVPPTLQALLAARLDQLEAQERSVLERGAVEGEIFHRGSVQALSGEGQVTPRLAALVRKELIRPDRTQLPAEDAFRFRHLLIRDAAYHALPKAVRAELHERFALWLEEHGADIVELDEILGYHLEQAVRYRLELGMDDKGLADEARRRLTEAGRRAALRGDEPASAQLLARAVRLLPPDGIDLVLEIDCLRALFWAGRREEALANARSLNERGVANGDRVAELCGKLEEVFLRIFFEPEGATQELAALVETALPEFERAQDHAALHLAYQALAQIANMEARADAMAENFERAAFHAQASGSPSEYLGWRATALFFGTTPASDVLAWLDEQEARGTSDRRLGVRRAQALGMLGRLDEARAVMSDVHAQTLELGSKLDVANLVGHDVSMLELLAGNPEAAVACGEEAERLYEELGERSFASTAVAYLALAYCELGRFDDAEAAAARADELGASDDALTETLWRQAQARVLAHRGEHPVADRVAREGVEIAETMDMLDAQAGAYEVLGEVLSLADRTKEAAEALQQALSLYERKENLVMAKRVRERLGELVA